MSPPVFSRRAPQRAWGALRELLVSCFSRNRLLTIWLLWLQIAMREDEQEAAETDTKPAVRLKVPGPRA